MLNFSNLSSAQKKCVVALIEAQPSLRETGHVTFKDINTITSKLTSSRASGAPKIGYPNWLFAANKISRGLYQLPLPTDEQLVAFKQESSSPVSKAKAKISKLTKLAPVSIANDAETEAFNKICRENGIAV